MRLMGVGVSPGRAGGPVVRVAEPLPQPSELPAPADPAAEAARIRPAAVAVAERLFQRAASATGDARGVLETTATMATDPALIARAEALVADRKLAAAQAVSEAADGFAGTLRAAGGYLAERVPDVHDVRDRIIAELLGRTPPGVPELDGPSVLVARDLAPADTADLDPDSVLALVTEEGGPTSHTAILARSLGIPAVVAVAGVLGTASAGATVDGDTGEVVLSTERIPARAAQRGEQPGFTGAGVTADGHQVRVLANVGAVADAVAAVLAGAQGIGLFRTELCYLAAEREPAPEVQRAAYREVLAPFAGKPVVVRTLDAGADKPLPFLRMDAEPNPALGVRGLRIAFDRPDVLDRQLTAIAEAAGDCDAEVSVMAPMVATAAEAAWFAERARAAGLARAGAMIEIPAAAMTCAEILGAVDFVSIGTNDLAQYLFAADRVSGQLAALNDPWQPALLRLLAQVGEAGLRHGKPVGVCGEAAADPLLAGVLAGFGITSLSMTPAAIGAVGAGLSAHAMADFRRAGQAALAADNPTTAREAVRQALDD